MTAPTTEALKPCPFCGGEGWNVRYFKCGCGATATCVDRNTRPSPTQDSDAAWLRGFADYIAASVGDTTTDRLERIAARLEAPIAEDALVERVRSEIINSPETADFMAGVPIEAAHQRERWPSDHDEGKTAFDWFWLIGYLAQKAAAAAVAGDTDKAMHHTISTAGALANWHAQLSGKSNVMRPGIEPPSRAALQAIERRVRVSASQAARA